MLFMAIQVYGLKLRMLLGLPLGINPVGISTSLSQMWGYHLGRVQAVLNGSSMGGRTGAMVARVREEPLHSSLLGIRTLPEAIMISLKGSRV